MKLSPLTEGEAMSDYLSACYRAAGTADGSPQRMAVWKAAAVLIDQYDYADMHLADVWRRFNRSLKF
jgi:hypothetical protein